MIHCIVRSNLSISPEDSWLPIASILFCIVHIQVSPVFELWFANVFSYCFFKSSPFVLRMIENFTLQLEASIRNGDIQGFRLFRNVVDQQSSSTKKKGRLNRHQEMSKVLFSPCLDKVVHYVNKMSISLKQLHYMDLYCCQLWFREARMKRKTYYLPKNNQETLGVGKILKVL